MRKKVIIAAAAGALALAAGLVLLLARLGSPGAAPRYAVVYEKGSQNLFAALPQGSFPLRARGSQQRSTLPLGSIHAAQRPSAVTVHSLRARVAMGSPPSRRERASRRSIR